MSSDTGSDSATGLDAPTIDWGVGRYEPTAAQLLPAARVVVDRAAPRAGETVLDVGCGTGNAALLAAVRGASVTGVDPAARLLEVARGRAKSEGLDIDFVPGHGAAIPVADGFADAVVSVFAVIFAPDPLAAVRELVRVTAPGGRIVLSDWLPGGALMKVSHAAGEFISAALGLPQPGPSAPDAPPSLAWYDRDALTEAFAPYGYEVELTREKLAFIAPSADQFMEDVSFQHPMAVGGLTAISQRDDAAALEAELRALVRSMLEAANEDPNRFRFTADYVVATARPTHS